ncbi:hypothetical protein TNCV_2300781 [Trichonephila clavipes]|nr:hypothetical protein TNCV_2300781 [Trichonephila clavipes]
METNACSLLCPAGYIDQRGVGAHRCGVQGLRCCDGSIRVASANPLGKSLGYHSRLFPNNPSEEEKNRDIQIKSNIYSQGFLASNEEKEKKKSRSQCNGPLSGLSEEIAGFQDEYLWSKLRTTRRVRYVQSATRGFLATDLVILNHGQVTRMTPEVASPSPNYHTTPTGGRFSSQQI